MKLFEKLFNKTEKAATQDGLTQEEREAIIDLLILGAYADSQLTLAEEEVFDGLKGSMNWESVTDISDYIDSSTAKARAIRSNPPAVNRFLEEVKARLASRSSITKALNLLHKVFISDGRSYEEANFYRRVENLLKH